jgi:hypothetical protein
VWGDESPALATPGPLYIHIQTSCPRKSADKRKAVHLHLMKIPSIWIDLARIFLRLRSRHANDEGKHAYAQMQLRYR